MNVTVTRPGDLGEAELSRWTEIRQGSHAAASPFFAPEYTLAVGAARSDSRVAVLEDAGRIVGFFPFQGRARRAAPIGTGLTDYQGVISEPDLPWTAAELLDRVGVRSYTFDHVPAAQAQFGPHVRRRDVSRMIDLGGGFDAYLAERRRAGRNGPREALAKRRRLEREALVRFELDDRSPGLLSTLCGWKTEQHRRTASFPLFTLAWVAEVLERVRTTRSAGLSGIVSCLYADDRPIALNFGLRSGPVFHGWMLGYDTRWAKYSPGSILLVTVAEALSAHGVRTLDCGKGSEQFKQRFANGSVELGEGMVTVGRRAAARAWLERKAWRAASLGPLAKPVGRVRHRLLFQG